MFLLAPLIPVFCFCTACCIACSSSPEPESSVQVVPQQIEWIVYPETISNTCEQIQRDPDPECQNGKHFRDLLGR